MICDVLGWTLATDEPMVAAKTVIAANLETICRTITTSVEIDAIAFIAKEWDQVRPYSREPMTPKAGIEKLVERKAADGKLPEPEE